MAIEHVDHIVDLRRHLVMVEGRFPAEGETMLRDVERSQNPWGKPQAERADWTEGSTCGCSSPAHRRPRFSTGSVVPRLRRAGPRYPPARRRGCCRLRGSTSQSSARASPARRPGPADGNEYLPVVRRAERGDHERGRCDEDRRELPSLLQHARERVPRLRRRVRGRPSHRVARRSCSPGTPRPGRRDGGDHVPRLVLPRPAQRRDRCASRDRLPRRQAARDGAHGQAHVLLRGGRRAHVDGGARQPINAERAREAAATGASTLAVACPFCTIMLDDGVRRTATSCEWPTWRRCSPRRSRRLPRTPRAASHDVRPVKHGCETPPSCNRHGARCRARSFPVERCGTARRCVELPTGVRCPP